MALAALTEALQSGNADAARAVFETLLRREPLEPDAEAWLAKAFLAFDPGADWRALRAAMSEARPDAQAACRLFARLAFGAGYRAVGIAACRKVIVAAPGQGEATFLLCAMLLTEGSPDAQPLLQHCLTTAPNPARGWADIGAALQALGKREAALVCFTRCLPDATLLLRRGLIEKELGRLDAARKTFAEAVGREPAAARGWFLLGTAAQDGGDFAAAAQAYRRALALAPSLAEAAVNLGTVLQETGDVAGAKAAYRRAMAIRPDTFGRIAQALTTAPRGELWLDLDALRRSLLA